MATTKQSLDPNGRQLVLFDNLLVRAQAVKVPPKPGSLAHGKLVREMLKEATHNCPKSREEIAEEMSLLTGTRITKTQMDAMICGAKVRHRFPLEWLGAFLIATGTREPLAKVAEAVGCALIDDAEMLLLELGRLELERRQLADRERAVRTALGRVARR